MRNLDIAAAGDDDAEDDIEDDDEYDWALTVAGEYPPDLQALAKNTDVPQ